MIKIHSFSSSRALPIAGHNAVYYTTRARTTSSKRKQTRFSRGLTEFTSFRQAPTRITPGHNPVNDLKVELPRLDPYTPALMK